MQTNWTGTHLSLCNRLQISCLCFFLCEEFYQTFRRIIEMIDFCDSNFMAIYWVQLLFIALAYDMNVYLKYISSY